MPKKNVVKDQEGLQGVAVAVGSALGKLAAKIGLSETAAPAASKLVASKSAPKKKAAAKKAATRRAVPKKPRAGKKKLRR